MINLWQKIKDAIRKGLIKIGIIKKVNDIQDLREIPNSSEMYNLIEMWKSLYKGYYAEWHDIKYHTIDGHKTRTMDTINMAKAAANEMASLVFNERCEISIGDDDNPTAEFVDDVLAKNKFNKKFQDYLEYSFAMGGMVIKPYVGNDEIKLSFVTADCFIPIAWQNDNISEAVFINESQRGKKYYTLLEWHTWDNGTYVIRNNLYESDTQNEIGYPVSLSTLYPDLEEEVRIENIKKPLFVYFKPNSANNFDVQSPLGISLYANALDTMKAIDTAFDSFHREFRLGKKRIFVPDSMIRTVYDEKGRPQRYFDSSDEVYQGYPGDMDETKIHDIKVELRVEEHVAAINALLNLFAMQTGFSSGTFTFDGESMKTATEVISEQSKTFKSKQSHEVIIESALIELVNVILTIAELYGIYSTNEDVEVSVAFDDSIAEDKSAEIDKQIRLVQAELQSKRRAIMEAQGVTEEEAMLIIEEIIEEQKLNTPDIDDSILFGDRE